MDKTDETLNAVEGAQAVCDWFGYWPSFHDAEILDVHLARSGSSSIRVLTWHVNREVIENGYYRQEREAIVTFSLTGITDLELAGFSTQNVIFGLGLELSANGIRLVLSPCYGLAGYVDAAVVRVELTPGRDATWPGGAEV
jgi:hypothetical protein